MMAAADARWDLVVESLRRPYRVTLPMVALILLVPLYLFIPQLASGRPPHVPATALDHRIPLQPAWVLVYGPLYLFLILLPLFVIRTEAAIRQTIRAYLAVWITAYVCFWFYPTIAPRPDGTVSGEGFAVWGLNFLYSADPPYNCFPSLHVAHSFVSALSSYRVHRGLGVAALAGALLVGVSTLFTKQHYVMDVAAGILLASVACALFLRRLPAGGIPNLDRRIVPALALVVTAIVVVMAAAYGMLYMLGVEVR